MKCLRKFQWVKLPRDYPDMGKGMMAQWARLASRAAFRKGNASYCGHTNPVTPGMWSGGIVGVKSILGVRSRTKALEILNQLQELGYLTFTLDRVTKHLTYQITDWVVKCSGAECMGGTVYTTEGYGFLCLPRSITQRLVDKNRLFDEADAWLDLWCHTTFEDFGNAFSFLAPAVQFGRYGAVLTLETLGQRWGWEKTKVWRFFQKHGDAFSLCRLPSSFGCLIFNTLYPTGTEVSAPMQEDIMRILEDILISRKNTHTSCSQNERINRLIAWESRRLIISYQQSNDHQEPDSRVAPFPLITRAYISHGWNCKNCRNCIYACPGESLGGAILRDNIPPIRGPCYEQVYVQYRKEPQNESKQIVNGR